MAAIKKRHFERFQEIRNEMLDLLNEAYLLLPDGHVKERAKAYWYGIIEGNLDSTWRNGASMCTMLDTENELDVIEEDEEDLEYDEDEEDFEDDEAIVVNTNNSHGFDDYDDDSVEKMDQADVEGGNPWGND